MQLDGLANLVTGLGTEQDKSTYTQIVADVPLSADQALALYRFGGIAGKIIDIVPDDATRKWRTCYFPTGFNRKAFDELEKKLKVQKAFAQFGKFARLSGTAIIIPEVEGEEGNTALPFNINSISKNKKLVGLRVLSRFDLVANRIDTKTGRPMAYIDWRDGNKEYHPSRIIGPLDGIELTQGGYEKNSGWGGSVLDRCLKSLMSEGTTAAQIAPLIHDAFVKRLGIKNLASFLDGGVMEARLKERVMLGRLLESTQNAYIYDLDTETVTESSSTSATAGLASLLDAFGERLAGECDIPSTRLRGKAVSGLNTSASTNADDYDDKIAAYQTTQLDNHLGVVDEMMLRSCYGGVPEDYYYEWNPLDEAPESVDADTNLKKAQTAEIYTRVGAIVPAHVSSRIESEGPFNVDQEFVEAMKRKDGLIAGEVISEEALAGHAAAATAGESVQAQALNGAQIASLVEVAAKVRAGELSPEQAIEIVRLAVPSVDPETAKRLVGTPKPTEEVEHGMGPAKGTPGAAVGTDQTEQDPLAGFAGRTGPEE